MKLLGTWLLAFYIGYSLPFVLGWWLGVLKTCR
jgi:hypothetical protein